MKKHPAMSGKQKDSCKQCIHELLGKGMPTIDDTPLEFRLSVASIIGATGMLLSEKKSSTHSNFIDSAAVLMAYLSEATDEEILQLIRESKAKEN